MSNTGTRYCHCPRCYFHNSSDGQNRETCPTSDPSVLHPSKTRSHGQNQDFETATDLCHTEIFKQTSELSTDIESAFEPMQQPTSRQSDNPSTIEINDPNTKTIPQNESNLSRGGKYNLRPKPNPNYSEIHRH